MSFPIFDEPDVDHILHNAENLKKPIVNAGNEEDQQSWTEKRLQLNGIAGDPVDTEPEMLCRLATRQQQLNGLNNVLHQAARKTSTASQSPAIRPLGSACENRTRPSLMDMDAELPPQYEWYKDQIAGHHPSVIKYGMRQIGILKEHGSNTLLKLVQDGIRGANEVCLYEMIPSSSKAAGVTENGDLLERLGPLLPKYFGRKSIQIGDNEYDFMELEDVTDSFSMPCIMDVKIGKVTYDPLASEQKKAAEMEKCQSQQVFGFRILGYRMHANVLGEPRVQDKTWGRTRTEENVQQAFAEFLEGRPKDAQTIVASFLERLEVVQKWFSDQELLQFYASSLLFVYEGDSKRPPRVDVRMIDFSHVFRVEFGHDENYRHGLNYIYGVFKRIQEDMLSLPN